MNFSQYQTYANQTSKLLMWKQSQNLKEKLGNTIENKPLSNEDYFLELLDLFRDVLKLN